MPSSHYVIDLVKEVEISRSSRGRQIEALFDIPPSEKARNTWRGTVPLDEKPWNIGLVVGPSGSGKSSVAQAMFGDNMSPLLSWGGKSVIDDFDPKLSVEQIASACSAVGFNTMPAWLRPYAVLSNGEKFRVELARRLLELPDPVVVDEFTSVVDRQVAQIASHAVAKFVRKQNRQFVAVSCHYDIEEWLQPDWVLEPATMDFRWRSLRRRPEIEISIQRVRYETWRLFAPFHYLTAELHKAARCYCLFVHDRPAAFAGVIHFPHPKSKNIKRVSRLVTLPDWQGLGLAFCLVDTLGAAYKAAGFRLFTTPAHPSLVRSFDRSPKWSLKKKPGIMESPSPTQLNAKLVHSRPNAKFEYAGLTMPRPEAERLIAAGL